VSCIWSTIIRSVTSGFSFNVGDGKFVLLEAVVLSTTSGVLSYRPYSHLSPGSFRHGFQSLTTLKNLDDLRSMVLPGMMAVLPQQPFDND